MHTNQFTVQEAVDYMVDNTPFMDQDVARVDAEIYLKTPGSPGSPTRWGSSRSRSS